MGKVNGVNKLFELESTFPVDQIKVNGIKLWPVLRIYFGSTLSYNKDTRISAGKALKISMIFSIFYGFWNYLKPWTYIALSSSDQRKLVNGFWVDKMDFLEDFLGDGEILELPNPEHRSRSKLKNKQVSSKMIIYAIMWVIERFVRPKMDGLDLIKDIEKRLGIDIDEIAITKRFIAQMIITKVLIKWKKPKALFLITPYTNFGFVYAFKKAGLPVIEFQHGTINSGHFAYQVKNRIDDNLYPDYLLTTGSLEKEALSNSSYVNLDHIIPVGSFYIDYMLSNEIDRMDFEKMKDKYDIIVCVSAQDRLEEHYIPFLKEVAVKDTSIGYWILPRFRKPSYYDKFNLPDNIFFLDGYNTYEAILLSDFHTTINSTTAIESLALGTRNILINVNDLARSYFGNVLTDSELTVLVESPEQYVSVIQNFSFLDKKEVRERQNDLIKLNYKENLSTAIKMIFND